MLGALAIAGSAFAAESAATASAPEGRAAAVAAGIAQLTGLAISPLLVLVAIGWTDFARAGGGSAAALPLHASPWLLIPCSTVLALVLAKKMATPAIPLPIRKMLDAAEYLEAKLSALVAAGVLLPTIIGTMAASTGETSPAVQAAGLGAVLGSTIVLVPIALIVFSSVWITFHVVDALIVLSPFALLDVALASARVAILALVGLALLISPFLALVLCVPIIALSLLIAGWCVRLDLFALTVATDLLFRRGRSADPQAPLRCFLGSRGLGAPIRTMGHAEPRKGGVVFLYRPFFVLPQRSIELEAASPVLVRGAAWCALRDDGTRRTLLSLAPRYGPHHAAICRRFAASARDGVVRRSWNGLHNALESILGGAGASTRGDAPADARPQ
ncbi:MAG: hypothetical protein RL354_467 [Planctomycetota bacterium]